MGFYLPLHNKRTVKFYPLYMAMWVEREEKYNKGEKREMNVLPEPNFTGGKTI